MARKLAKAMVIVKVPTTTKTQKLRDGIQKMQLIKTLNNIKNKKVKRKLKPSWVVWKVAKKASAKARWTVPRLARRKEPPMESKREHAWEHAKEFE
jgi:hypothetical protein